MKLKNIFRKFLRETSGTTATEYAVMLGLILLFVIIGISATGGGVSGWWNNINSEMTTHGF